MSKLVIVESPAKAKTIQKYLGDGFTVLPTIGHIRELPKKDAIDPNNGYSMKYVVSPGKEDAVKKIKRDAKSAEQVILATDPDREGEAIAWHVADIISKAKFEQPDIKRAIFYEISEKAVKDAVGNPGEIAMDLVQSQETRRALDRHFGFSLSPLLWRLFPSNNHSAGRVQSPALRMIVEREREIEAFVPQEYWSISAKLEKDGEYDAKLSVFKEEPIKKFTFDSTTLVEEASKALEEGCKRGLVAKSITKKTIKRSPREPFRTSVLQQQASNRFGFTPKRTMQIAQSLYAREGGGLITYIRTDSIEIDEGKLDSAEKRLVIFLEDTKIDQKYINLAKLQLGKIHQSRGDYVNAIKLNKEILNNNPNDFDAAYNLSNCYLFTKNFGEAWVFHEKRFFCNSFALLKQNYNNIKKPQWDPTRPKKNILIWGEQGIGDQILYSQFVELIKDEFENMTLALNKKLIPFFGKIYPKLNYIDYKEINKFNNYDYHLPMGSLGLYFQKYVKKESFKQIRDYSEIENLPKKSLKKFPQAAEPPYKCPTK